MLKKSTVFVLFCLFVFTAAVVFAQQAENIEQNARQIEKDQLLRQKIETEKPAPQIEETQPPAAPAPLKTEEKANVQKIRVIGATLLKAEEINAVIKPYENKELTLADMQKVADLVTDAYRNKGYATSRALIPPQKIEAGVLEIRVVEGTIGNIEIKGNRYFRQALLKKAIKMSKGEPFNVNTLRYYLGKINAHPDRNVKAVLVPGKDPGTTDIVLEVKDNLPVHLGLSWDNFASRFIRKNRYNAQVTDNNLLGFDDILTLQYQLSDGQDYKLYSLRYLFPATEKLKLGFFASSSKLTLGKEYRDLLARGKSRMYSLYSIYDLIGTDNLSLNLNLGFDYLDSFNFQLNNEQSRDRLRIAKIGFDLDVSDQLLGWRGRTIFSPEFDFGFSSIMGGLKDQDRRASRSGSGGKFIKNTFNLLRLQQLPWESTLLWKNQIQKSPYILTASEQFQLGGISNVRGYPSAEYVGDEGYSMTWEYSVPPYFFPKSIKVPFSRAKFYDAFRLVGFYDWGNVRLRRPQAGEEKYKTLRGAGCGIRFNLPENFFIRADFAWPLDKTPSDNNHFHPWIQVSKEF